MRLQQKKNDLNTQNAFPSLIFRCQHVMKDATILSVLTIFLPVGKFPSLSLISPTGC